MERKLTTWVSTFSGCQDREYLETHQGKNLFSLSSLSQVEKMFFQGTLGRQGYGDSACRAERQKCQPLHDMGQTLTATSPLCIGSYLLLENQLQLHCKSECCLQIECRNAKRKQLSSTSLPCPTHPMLPTCFYSTEYNSQCHKSGPSKGTISECILQDPQQP